MKETSYKNALEIARILDNKKAEDVKILDIRNLSSFTDFFVIATGTSTRHTVALADEVEEKMFQKNVILKHKEGYTNGRWILLDYSDVIVHIFTKEDRDFYDLERIWKGANYIELDVDREN